MAISADNFGAQRDMLRSIFSAGVQAAAPDSAIFRHVRLDGDTLCIDENPCPLRNRRIFVLGAGKGAAPMAAALESILGDRITSGHVIVKYDHTLPLRYISLSEAAHPVPDAAGMTASSRILDMAEGLQEDDLVLCLFTGGASALAPAPAKGTTLSELQRITSLLLGCGATINEMNAIRKHLSRWSGGQLARVLAPAEVHTLIVSDVIGDDLSVIASGPTVADASTYADCMEILRKYDLLRVFPDNSLEILQSGIRGEIPETPKQDDPAFARVHNVLVASNIQALQAAARKAEELGFETRILTDSLSGEARDAANELVSLAQNGTGPGKRVCLLAGGETTVSLQGSGKGGRNQEMALAAALSLENWPGICGLFAGTDGTDGPTDAAGGFAMPDTVARIRAAGGDPLLLLDNNDSYRALELSGDLLITGPTRTNVMDISILLLNS